MKQPTSWGGWPPSSAHAASRPHPSSTDFVPPEGCDPVRCSPSITMLLGQMMAGQQHLIRSVDDIHHALERGDWRMQRLDDMSSRLDERVGALERSARKAMAGSGEVSISEARLVRWLVYIIPGAALAGTGSWDTAIKLLTALK